MSTIPFSLTTNAKIIDRVTTGGRAEQGLGYPTLIPHKDLSFNPAINCQYLKNDCLCFNIVAVESLSESEVLPTKLAMKNFEQCKIDCNTWYSPPFYTHTQGYKMRLTVDADGNGTSKGTHVSVYICLMQGEFDNDLKWPFRGNIAIKLLDQEQNGEEHITEVIRFTTRKPGERVTIGERRLEWGKPQFIPHTNLTPKYLKNDLLQFQVTNFELKT